MSRKPPVILLATVLAFLLAALLLWPSREARASPGETFRVSVDSAGNQANKASRLPAISNNGSYIAFSSNATNLVQVDTNNAEDVFVRDRQSGETSLVSVSSAGEQGNDLSFWPAISADGRYVAFWSYATNLVQNDTNVFCDRDGVGGYNDNCWDIFWHDRQTGETRRVSVSSTGDQANGYSEHPTMSADGRYVAFESNASNLVAGDTNYANDIFVHDTQTNTSIRVSVNSAGEQALQGGYWPAISADGRFLAFQSTAANLVPSDTNNCWDIFVHDQLTGETTRVSVDSAGIEGNAPSLEPRISADGRYVAFRSYASNLVSGDTNGWFTDVFVHDRVTGHTTRASVNSAGNQASSESDWPAVSPAGYVVFSSQATNLVQGDTNGVGDVFVHDLNTGQTTRVSVGSAGVQSNGFSAQPTVSADGRYVAYQSGASNLVPDDTNDDDDVFVYDRLASPVGGIAELPDIANASANEAGAPTEGSGWSASAYAALASGLAAALVALGTGAWYARRQSLR